MTMIGARIAALRRKYGLSQAELARKLGVSASAVGMYEQGRREPAADLLVNMARQFGVSTDYLLTGHPGDDQDNEALTQTLLHSLDASEQRNTSRDRVFSRQELAVLMAAMLIDP
jgi:transcriptional regulator with XRE-family HTH domain